MSVSIIEGKVIEAPVKVQRKAVLRYAHVAFERRDGQVERVGRVVAAKEIADLVTPGAEGRFYMFKAIDVTGIAGVRLADGTARFAYPGNNLTAFGILIVVSIAWMAVRVLATGDFPVLGLLLLGLGIFGYVTTRNNRAAGRRQFDADAGQGHAAPDAPAPVATAE